MVKKVMGNVLSGAAFALGLAGLALYVVTMNKTTTALPEILFYIFTVCGLATLLVTVMKGSKSGLLPIVSSMTLFAGFMVFFNGQLGNLGYWVYHIRDIGDGLLPSFVAGEIVLLLAVILELVTVFVRSESILNFIHARFNKNTK